MAASMMKHVFTKHKAFLTILPKPNVLNVNCCRGYARTLHRKPVRVLTAHEAKHVAQNKGKLPPKTQMSEKEMWKKAATVNIDDTETNGLPLGMKYEKLREGDKRFGPVVMAAKSRKERQKKSLFVLEGSRLITEAIQANIKVKSIYFTNVEVLGKLPLSELREAELYKVMKSHMKVWSDVKEPQGLLAVCQMPSPNDMRIDTTSQLPISLICDQIRDPGNLGTILRTAVAVGCSKVLLTKGCVDMWDPKVLRSGAGAHFKTLIHNNLGWEVIGGHLGSDVQVCLADNRSEIPMINTKSAKYKQAMKQIFDTEQNQKFDEEEAEASDSEETVEVDESFLNMSQLAPYAEVPLSVNSVFDMHFLETGSALVIGGETEGLSVAARKLCFDRHGGIAYLPMAQGIESLNAGTAAAVILYEMKRQLLQRTTGKEVDSLKN